MKQTAATASTVFQNRQLIQRQKVIRMLSYISLSFVICWTPFNVTLLIASDMRQYDEVILFQYLFNYFLKSLFELPVDGYIEIGS